MQSYQSILRISRVTGMLILGGLEVSGHEMQKFLALLLGAAVHSSQKEHFIERIKCMPVDLQEAIVEEIRKVSVGGRGFGPLKIQRAAKVENGP